MKKLSYRHLVLFSLSVTSLLTGFFIYLFYQPNTLFLYFLAVNPFDPYTIQSGFLRNLIINYAGDITWCISLYLTALIFYELGYLRSSGKITILTLPFIFEAGQHFKIIPGTFDSYDLFAYAIILFIFSGIVPSLNILKNEKG